MKKIIVLLFLLTSVGMVSAQTIEELRDSMAAGNLNMQVELALRYIEGDGVEQDCQEGLRLIRDAVDKGNRYGELRLGLCYDYGICVERNQETAFQWYLKSAEKGNILALFFVGQAYQYGEGVEQNIQEAYRYYQKSADGGYPRAMAKMGDCYLYGKGVEQDLGKAFELTKQAADDDEEYALFSLARYYFNGWGTKVDKSEALRIMNQVRETADEESPYKEKADYLAAIIERGDTMRTYELQFRYIPSILQSYQHGDLEYDELLDIRKWEIDLRSIFVSHFEWDWKAVSATVHEYDSATVILYHMPEPERMPLCRYAAAVIDKNRRFGRYYTLERSINFSDDEETLWMMGGEEGTSHFNYGPLKGKPTEENFLKRVLELWDGHKDVRFETKENTLTISEE
ncbi:MAG: sel1 repeat family protein [Prevotella sp.]|nr:sel1 repeat family protein [Prevotella sp.]